MKNIYLLVLSFIFIMSGCLEDEGNYEYDELNKITVLGIPRNVSFVVGDTVKANIRFRFATDSIGDDGLDFMWKVNEGDTISLTRNLEYVVKEPGYTKLFMQIHDKKANTYFYGRMSFSVKSLYQSGWMVLSEKDGKSSLNFIRPYKEIINVDTEDEETINKFAEYTDIYKTINGEELGTDPLMLQEFRIPGQNKFGAEMLVVQNGGQKSICLDRVTLKKSFDVVKEFQDETYPDDFKPVEAFYGGFMSYYLNYDGKLYGRKQAFDDLHAGYFLHRPVEFEGKSLNIDDIIDTNPVYNTALALIHDKTNNRLIGIRDNYNGTYSGKMSNIIYSTPVVGAEDLNNINKEYIDCQLSYEAYYQNCSFVAFFKDVNQNKIYAQEFTLDAYIGISGTPEEYEIPNSQINDNSKFLVLRKQEYIFITSGANNDKLYLFDRNNKTSPPVLVKDFTGRKITCLTADKNTGSILALGFEDGKIEIYDISPEILINQKIELLHSSQNNFGKIVNIEDKIY